MGNKRNKERKMSNDTTDEQKTTLETISTADVGTLSVALGASQDLTIQTEVSVQTQSLPIVAIMDVLDAGGADSGTKTIEETAVPQPERQIKLGTLVDSNQGKLGTKATAETENRAAKANTAKPEEIATSAFEKKLQSVSSSGTDREKFVASMVGEYVKAMAPGVPLTPDVGYRNQLALLRTITNVIETEENFVLAFRLLIAFVREHRKGAFDDKYAYRFYEFAKAGDSSPKTHSNLVTILIVAAGLQNKRDLRKFLSLDKALSSGISEAGRQRVIQYFNA